MKNIKPAHWLIMGISLTILGQMRFGIGLLGFLEPIPFLIYIERSKSSRSKLYLFVALLIGWTLATAKIVTDPIPWFISPAYGLPMALFKAAAYFSFIFLKDSKGTAWLFPAVFVLSEWAQANLTPFATWGSMAYTQVNNIVWLQIVSITGIWGLSFVIYFISYQIYCLISNRGNRLTPLVILAPIILVSTYGAVRLTLSENTTHENITVAAVGTDSRIGPSEFPQSDARAANREGIYQRMEIAAQAGAELVVWTEAAAGILPEEEVAFKSEVSSRVDSLNITAVIGYVIPLQFNPLKYENKYIVIDSTGEVIHEYYKHEPVPGEPAVKGTEPHEAFSSSGVTMGGAICYDFDFPNLGLQLARLGVDIVALPSSDWRGIDPIHTQMAAFRAVEGGYSLVRSTRWGLSAAVDHHGRIRAQLSDNDRGDKILWAQLPMSGVKTVYEVLGDWLPLLCVILILTSKFIAKKP